MKKVVVFLLGFMAVASLALAGDASFERVKAKGELAIGLDDSFPPMGYRIDDGTLVGFDVDVAEALGKRLGIKIKWVPTAWDGVIHSLNSGKFDCIWNGMTITEERAARVNFSKPYIVDGQVAVVKFSDQRYRSYKDLGAARIGAQKGSSALKAVAKLPTKPAVVKQYMDNPKALLDLKAGRIDAVVIDNVTGRDAIAKSIGEYKTLEGFISREPFGVAFRKSDIALHDMVQKILDEMVADGEMARISRKWFAEDITDPSKW